jgi:hypothetical protein
LIRHWRSPSPRKRMNDSNRPRKNSSARENIGLRHQSQHSVSSLSLEDRTTITNPAHLFQRSHSNASISTERSNEYNGNLIEKKIVFQTAHRRSSVSGLDESTVPRLVYNTSYGGKMQFYINKEENSIGRREQNDIVLNDFKVSKKHAVILKTSTGYFSCAKSDMLLKMLAPPMA